MIKGNRPTNRNHFLFEHPKNSIWKWSMATKVCASTKLVLHFDIGLTIAPVDRSSKIGLDFVDFDVFLSD